MFFFFFNNKLEIKLGASPREADLAIVSINAGGTVGELNQMVLDEYGYDKSILRNLDLQKGFDYYEGVNRKSILFVVTVGRGATENNLYINLLSCLEYYSDVLHTKKVWIPLMGTGAGELTLAQSFKITEDVIKRYSERSSNLKCEFLLSIPRNKDGQLLYNRTVNQEKKSTSDESIDNTINLILNKTDYKFHLVGSNWDSQGDQSNRFYEEEVWENGYGEDKFGDRVNKVAKGDILLNKSTYAKHDGTNYLRIKGIAIVTQNPKNSVRIYCHWIAKNLKIDIQDLSNYRDTISEPSTDGLKTILSSLDDVLLQEILDYFTGNKEFRPSPPSFSETNLGDKENDSLKVDIEVNTTTLAGLISDTDSGTDYLEITKDVNAFARVMAAKSFEPPLAIALLGKWGSGKSFFMRKLKDGIQNLSEKNPENQFCEGIAHVHFNAWSYMDANLWACFVTRIFESLDDYIKGTFATEKEKKEIENQLFNKLNVSKEQLVQLNKQKESIDINIQKLQTKKDKLKSQLERKIDAIKSKTLTNIIRKVDEEFNVRSEIEKTLQDNPTFTATVEEFKNIVPEKYWDNPTEFYKQLKSGYSFLKAFFHRDKVWKNLAWISVIIIIILVTPIFTYITNLLLSWQDFTLTNSQWITITLVGSAFVRGIDTFLKLKKQIAPFWKIKEDYEAKKTNALFEFEQEEKAIRLEIDNFKLEITQIDNQIQLNKEIKATLEFKLKNALSTEALYTFIEKRANSDDYKKHLGIVSLIRKDFEILSGLLTGHQTELVSNQESKEFKELFGNKKPLERIILYIDDLDRCPEDRVVEVLEAVNLLMAFPLFVVVVGVDPRWVKTALTKKYKNQFNEIKENEDSLSPSNYLEKIFQVPFHLKDATDNSIKHMIKTLAQVKPTIIRMADIEFENENGPLLDHPEVEHNIPLDDGAPPIEDILNNSSKERTTLANKESIEALEITEKECELLQDMSEIIGNNPRAIKRFVNTYRIIKTHEDFGFANENHKEDELVVIMFLLAITIGKFKILTDSIEKNILFATENVRPEFDYFSGAESFEITSKEYSLKRELNRIISKKHAKIKIQKIELYKRHYQFIKRFTFKNI